MEYKYEIGQTVWYEGRKYAVLDRDPPKQQWLDWQFRRECSYHLQIILPDDGFGYVMSKEVSHPHVFESALHSKPLDVILKFDGSILARRDCADWDEVVAFVREVSLPAWSLVVNGREKLSIHTGKIVSRSMYHWDLECALLDAWASPSPFDISFIELDSVVFPSHVPLFGWGTNTMSWTYLQGIETEHGGKIWYEMGLKLKEM